MDDFPELPAQPAVPPPPGQPTLPQLPQRPPAPPPPQPAAPFAPTTSWQPTVGVMPAPPKRKSRTWLWITLGVVVAALAVGAVVLVMQGSSTSSVSRSTEVPGTVPSDGKTTSGKGGWTMVADLSWIEGTNPTPTIEHTWLLSHDTTSKVRDQVNVYVDSKTKSTITLEKYLAVSADTLPSLITDGTVVTSQIVTRPDGTEYGRMVYTGTILGVSAKVLAITVKNSTGFITVSLITNAAHFDRLVGDVEPYIRTLHAT